MSLAAILAIVGLVYQSDVIVKDSIKVVKVVRHHGVKVVKKVVGK